jgi:hypothetical protein
MPKRKAVDDFQHSRLIEYVLALFCGPVELAALANTCKYFQGALSVLLTSRITWPSQVIAQWPAWRIKNVRRATIGSRQLLAELPGLTHLTVLFNDSINSLPIGLTQLTLGDSFNSLLCRLPDGLQQLTLGNRFDQPLGALPSGLKQLTIESSFFNHSLGVLPDGLTHLKLSTRYNQPLGKLPDSLQHLTLSTRFNYTGTIVPSTLAKLEFGKQFDQWSAVEKSGYHFTF